MNLLKLYEDNKYNTETKIRLMCSNLNDNIYFSDEILDILSENGLLSLLLEKDILKRFAFSGKRIYELFKTRTNEDLLRIAKLYYQIRYEDGEKDLTSYTLDDMVNDLVQDFIIDANYNTDNVNVSAITTTKGTQEAGYSNKDIVSTIAVPSIESLAKTEVVTDSSWLMGDFTGTAAPKTYSSGGTTTFYMDHTLENATYDQLRHVKGQAFLSFWVYIPSDAEVFDIPLTTESESLVSRQLWFKFQRVEGKNVFRIYHKNYNISFNSMFPVAKYFLDDSVLENTASTVVGWHHVTIGVMTSECLNPRKLKSVTGGVDTYHKFFLNTWMYWLDGAAFRGVTDSLRLSQHAATPVNILENAMTLSPSAKYMMFLPFGKVSETDYLVSDVTVFSSKVKESSINGLVQSVYNRGRGGDMSPVFSSNPYGRLYLNPLRTSQDAGTTSISYSLSEDVQEENIFEDVASVLTVDKNQKIIIPNSKSQDIDVSMKKIIYNNLERFITYASQSGYVQVLNYIYHNIFKARLNTDHKKGMSLLYQYPYMLSFFKSEQAERLQILTNIASDKYDIEYDILNNGGYLFQNLVAEGSDTTITLSVDNISSLYFNNKNGSVVAKPLVVPQFAGGKMTFQPSVESWVMFDQDIDLDINKPVYIDVAVNEKYKDFLVVGLVGFNSKGGMEFLNYEPDGDGLSYIPITNKGENSMSGGMAFQGTGNTPYHLKNASADVTSWKIVIGVNFLNKTDSSVVVDGIKYYQYYKGNTEQVCLEDVDKNVYQESLLTAAKDRIAGSETSYKAYITSLIGDPTSAFSLPRINSFYAIDASTKVSYTGTVQSYSATANYVSDAITSVYLYLTKATAQSYFINNEKYKLLYSAASKYITIRNLLGMDVVNNDETKNLFIAKMNEYGIGNVVFAQNDFWNYLPYPESTYEAEKLIASIQTYISNREIPAALSVTENQLLAKLDSWIKAKRPIIKLSTPSNVSVVTDNMSANINWDMNYEAIRYEVYVKYTEKPSHFAHTFVTYDSVLTFNNANLPAGANTIVNGKSYTYKIRSISSDSAKNSEWTQEATFMPAPKSVVPVAPSANLSLSFYRNDKAIFYFNPVENAMSYEVQYSINNQTSWQTVTGALFNFVQSRADNVNKTMAAQIPLTTKTNGTVYFARIRAVNSKGNSAWSSVVTGTISITEVCGKPTVNTDLLLVPERSVGYLFFENDPKATSYTLEVSINSNLSYASKEILEFNVTRKEFDYEDLSNKRRAYIRFGLTSTSFGTRYYARIKANNSAGSSAYSSDCIGSIDMSDCGSFLGSNSLMTIFVTEEAGSYPYATCIFNNCFDDQNVLTDFGRRFLKLAFEYVKDNVSNYNAVVDIIQNKIKGNYTNRAIFLENGLNLCYKLYKNLSFSILDKSDAVTIRNVCSSASDFINYGIGCLSTDNNFRFVDKRNCENNFLIQHLDINRSLPYITGTYSEMDYDYINDLYSSGKISVNGYLLSLVMGMLSGHDKSVVVDYQTKGTLNLLVREICSDDNRYRSLKEFLRIYLSSDKTFFSYVSSLNHYPIGSIFDEIRNTFCFDQYTNETDAKLALALKNLEQWKYIFQIHGINYVKPLHINENIGSYYNSDPETLSWFISGGYIDISTMKEKVLIANYVPKLISITTMPTQTYYYVQDRNNEYNKYYAGLEISGGSVVITTFFTPDYNSSLNVYQKDPFVIWETPYYPYLYGITYSPTNSIFQITRNKRYQLPYREIQKVAYLSYWDLEKIKTEKRDLAYLKSSLVFGVKSTYDFYSNFSQLPYINTPLIQVP